MKIFQGLDTCPHINVLHTQHDKKGDIGRYFYFDETKMDAMVGNRDWSGKTFKIFQKGSRLWSGTVIAWRRDSNDAAHGRRNQYSGNNQWVTGDTLEICKSGNFQQSFDSIHEPINLC